MVHYPKRYRLDCLLRNIFQLKQQNITTQTKSSETYQLRKLEFQHSKSKEFEENSHRENASERLPLLSRPYSFKDYALTN